MVPGNGLNPVYNEEPFVFRKVVLPDLAVLRIAVYDENAKMLGQRILPLDGLQAGYRHISLRTEGNFPLSLASCFICIELKIYVPDGLGDLMDALSDPRAFISAQEKRIDQMKAMGIEETDIKSDIKDVKLQEDGKKMEYHMEFLTVDMLKYDKFFVRLTRKHQKDMDSLKKKHQKEKSSIQKHQCLAIEKVTKSAKTNVDVTKDAAVKDVVVQQVKQWTELLDKLHQDEWELYKTQKMTEADSLRKILLNWQSMQIKHLETMFERENKEMKAKQAKVSVDTAKEVANDKTLRNKAEKERRLKEKNSNNTKKFIEERKSAALKQDKERERTKKTHEKESQELEKYIESVSSVDCF